MPAGKCTKTFHTESNGAQKPETSSGAALEMIPRQRRAQLAVTEGLFGSSPFWVNTICRKVSFLPIYFNASHAMIESILSGDRKMNSFKALPLGPDHSLFSVYWAVIFLAWVIAILT